MVGAAAEDVDLGVDADVALAGVSVERLIVGAYRGQEQLKEVVVLE